MRKLITTIALALALAAPALAQPTHLQPTTPPLEQSDVDAWLDGLVPSALQAGDMAGAVVTIVANGEVLTLRGYGDLDAETGQPINPETTLFRLGSVSKLITWTAVMQQVERGALELDTDIQAYLDFTIPPFDGQPITLRNILTHTAGFEEQLKHVIAHDRAEILGFEGLVRNFMPARIFAPGSTPAYSNYATALAGYIVERVSDQSFADYAADNIFAPLGMDTATFSQDLSEAQLANLSKSYALASGEATPF
jgi:CubicO group peptidase (beta-lactamase class C family)